MIDKVPLKCPWFIYRRYLPGETGNSFLKGLGENALKDFVRDQVKLQSKNLKRIRWNCIYHYWKGPGQTAFLKVIVGIFHGVHDALGIKIKFKNVQFHLVPIGNCECSFTWFSAECLSAFSPSPYKNLWLQFQGKQKFRII